MAGYKLIRRQWLRLSVYGSILSGIGYAHWIEPSWLEISEKRVNLKNLTKPIRLLHISDLHASNTTPLTYLDQAIDLSLSTQPDLICVTGDFISTAILDIQQYRKILQKLANFAPTFACLGNHDGGQWAIEYGGYSDTLPILQLLKDSGIHCLHNTSQTVIIKQQPLSIVGVGDIWTEDFKPEVAFAKLPKITDKPIILLSHNPDSKALLTQYTWNLMLSGHTHGGQFVVPWLGNAPFAPVHDKQFVQGLHEWETRYIHITRGIGNLYGLRFNCRPEISVLELL